MIYPRELCRQYHHRYVIPGSHDHALLMPHVPQSYAGPHKIWVRFLPRGRTVDTFADGKFRSGSYFRINWVGVNGMSPDRPMAVKLMLRRTPGRPAIEGKETAG